MSIRIVFKPIQSETLSLEEVNEQLFAMQRDLYISNQPQTYTRQTNVIKSKHDSISEIKEDFELTYLPYPVYAHEYKLKYDEISEYQWVKVLEESSHFSKEDLIRQILKENNFDLTYHFYLYKNPSSNLFHIELNKFDFELKETEYTFRRNAEFLANKEDDFVQKHLIDLYYCLLNLGWEPIIV